MRRSDAAAVANPPRRDRPNCGEAERECGFCGERLRVCIAAVCGATPCACDPGVPSWPLPRPHQQGDRIADQRSTHEDRPQPPREGEAELW